MLHYTSTLWYCSSRLLPIHYIYIYISVYPIQYVAPGPVSELSYEEDTDTSVNVTWKPPKEPNGVIRAYFVEHGVYQNEPTTSVRLLAGGPMYTVIQGLGEFSPLHIFSIPRHAYQYYTWQQKHFNHYLTTLQATVYITFTMFTHHYT